MLETISTFSAVGNWFTRGVLVLSSLLGGLGIVNLFSPKPVFNRQCRWTLAGVALAFVAGFFWICWFHYQIYSFLPLQIPKSLVDWLNSRLAMMNNQSAYGLPLYDLANPPRYSIPVWIEDEKYFFWFMCFSVMVFVSHRRIYDHQVRGVLYIVMAIQAAILFLVFEPFKEPLPKFFSEIKPWFENELPAMYRLGQFMRLYPRMVFYYNAEYMWLHPPLLFLSYSCMTITFVTSVFMLFWKKVEVERLGYDYAKLGYFLLTLGMLLGYPWALKAWGPNWWWDPKICSSIMMWAVFSTYLHVRIYIAKPGMWYFSSCLGILCYVAMLFTFLSTFFFPGEHTLQ